MLKGVLDGWIEAITEREFDAPFLLLLRSHGFFDIHFTHGAYEFGKDFIAKRTENGVVEQWGFQSKAGDISGSGWDKFRGQFDELVGSWLVHPNYDVDAPRQHRLLLTGELRGKAILSAKELRERIKTRGEGNFEIWDRETLLDLLSGQDPRFPIVNLSADIERILGRVIAGDAPMSWLVRQLDGHGREFASIAELRFALLHLSCLVTALQRSGLDFHAVRCAQHAARIALHHWLRSDDAAAAEEYRVWIRYGLRLGLGSARANAAIEPEQLVALSAPSLGMWVAYPHACINTCESFGLAVLSALDEGRIAEASMIASELADFIAANPGCAHPTIDRQAPAVMISLVALLNAGRESSARDFARSVTKWTCDLIGDALGLAAPSDDESAEVRRLLGSPFDFVDIPQRKDSLLAVALCDVTYILLQDLYPDVVNDFKAVGAIPSALFPLDEPWALFNIPEAAQSMVNIDYPDEVSTDLLPHHALQRSARQLEVRGGVLAAMLAACLCGNRLFSDVLPRLKRMTDGRSAPPL